MAQREKETFGFRASTDLADNLKEFATEEELSRSDAIRALLRSGLESRELESRVDALEERVERLEERVSEPLWRRWLL